MMVKATKMNSSRGYSGMCSLTLTGGRVCAAASVTTPRIPAQAITVGTVTERALLTGPDAGDQPGQVGRRVHPDEPQRHQHREDQQGDLDGGADVGLDVAADAAQLQADQQEDDALEQEGDQFPDRVHLQPGGSRQQVRDPVPQVQPGDHHGDDARRVQALGHDHHDERGEQRHRVVEQRVEDLAVQLGRGERRDQADQHPAAGLERDLPGDRPEPDRGTAERGHRHPHQHQRGGVVEQALTLQDGHHPAGQPDPAGDRGWPTPRPAGRRSRPAPRTRPAAPRAAARAPGTRSRTR